MEAAIVILNYNGKNHLEKYLPGVIKHLAHKYSIYIVDNASTDESVQWINKNAPFVSVINNQQNYGFAKGYNIGLQTIKAQYYVLLNSDIRVEEDFVSPLIQYAEGNHKIAVVQPKILDDKNPSLFEYAGAAGGFIDSLGFPFCRGRIFQHLEKDFGQYDDPMQCFWASGAAMLIKSSVFKKVHGFDERFFAHMEEIDMCWRIQNEGYEIHIYPKAKVFHLGGGTLQYGSQRKIFLNYRNNLWMILKNSPYPIKILFIRKIMDFLAIVQFLTKGNIRGAKAILTAYWAFYKNFNTVYKERKRGQKVSTPLIDNSILWMVRKSIVTQYFLLGRKKYSDMAPYGEKK
jgi:GT2 family glycosyltransferase